MPARTLRHRGERTAPSPVPVPASATASRPSLRADRCAPVVRSEEHTSELQSLMRNSYAVSCLKKKKNNNTSSNFNLLQIVTTHVLTQTTTTRHVYHLLIAQQ